MSLTLHHLVVCRYGKYITELKGSDRIVRDSHLNIDPKVEDFAAFGIGASNLKLMILKDIMSSSSPASSSII